MLRSRLWLILLIPLLLAGVAYGLSSSRTPTYSASSQLVIHSQERRGVFDADTGFNREPIRAIQTEIQVILGEAVREAVLEEIPDPATVSAGAVGLTDVVEITAESTDPELAARTADAYGSAYIEHRRQRAVDTFLAAGEEIQRQLSELDSQIDELDRSITASGQNNADALVARRNALIAQQALFSQRLDQLQVDAALQESSAESISTATVPTTPTSPRPLRDATAAAAVGLLLATAAAFALQHLDETVRTKADVERAIGTTVPVVATIPATVRAKDTEDATVAPRGSGAAEGYRSLRTAVQFLSFDRQLSTLQVTSPMPGEGKTTTVANLAVAFADAGERVIVVSCDLRRPRVHEYFAVPNRVGFTSVLLGHADVWSSLQQSRDHPNVVVLSAGPPPPNPSELLSTNAAAQVFKQVKELADVVLIDSPPVLPVTDAAILAQYVDATLLVASAGQSTPSQLAEAVEQLRAVEAPLVGVALNRVEESSQYGGRYAYDSVAEPALRRRFRSRRR